MADNQSNSTAGFYVGYLPMTGTLAAVLVMIAGLMVGAGAGLAYVTASHQDDPGTGRWEADTPVELTGIVDMIPYPAIHLPDGDGDGIPETALLVSTGKIGAQERAIPFRGKPAVVQAFLVEREGRLLYELVDGADAIRAYDGSLDAQIPMPSGEDVGEATLRGEIIDTKCFLGVMKPGCGKAHKACATLCILGGIAPGFYVRHADGNSVFLLTGPNGEDIRDSILENVATPVQVSGRLERYGSITRFRIDPRAIERL